MFQILNTTNFRGVVLSQNRSKGAVASITTSFFLLGGWCNYLASPTCGCQASRHHRQNCCSLGNLKWLAEPDPWLPTPVTIPLGDSIGVIGKYPMGLSHWQLSQLYSIITTNLSIRMRIDHCLVGVFFFLHPSEKYESIGMI